MSDEEDPGSDGKDAGDYSANEGVVPETVEKISDPDKKTIDDDDDADEADAAKKIETGSDCAQATDGTTAAAGAAPVSYMNVPDEPYYEEASMDEEKPISEHEANTDGLKKTEIDGDNESINVEDFSDVSSSSDSDAVNLSSHEHDSDEESEDESEHDEVHDNVSKAHELMGHLDVALKSSSNDSKRRLMENFLSKGSLEDFFHTYHDESVDANTTVDDASNLQHHEAISAQHAEHSDIKNQVRSSIEKEISKHALESNSTVNVTHETEKHLANHPLSFLWTQSQTKGAPKFVFAATASSKKLAIKVRFTWLQKFLDVVGFASKANADTGFAFKANFKNCNLWANYDGILDFIVKGKAKAMKTVCKNKCNRVCGVKLKWKKGKLKKQKWCKDVCAKICNLKAYTMKINQSFNLLEGPSFAATNKRIRFEKGQAVGPVGINLAIRMQNKGKCKFNKWNIQIKAYTEIDLGRTSVKKGTGWINVAMITF